MKRFLKCLFLVFLFLCVSTIKINAESSDEGTAYAVLTDEGEMIFFRSNEEYTTQEENQTVTDILGNEYNGYIFTNIEASRTNPFSSKILQIRNIRVADGQIIRPVTMRWWFMGARYLQTFDGTGFDTSIVNNMESLFSDCDHLNEADITEFDTSHVSDMSAMFYNCKNLQMIDVSNFDTSNVTDMSFLFSGCENLVTIDVSNFDTSNVISMLAMFQTCQSITSIDVSHFDTSNVTDMSGMFSQCVNLKSLDVSNFDTSNVIKMGTMFQSCQSITSIDVSHFDTSNVTDMSGMFNNSSLSSTESLTNFDTSNVRDMRHMFANCKNLLSADLHNFDTAKVQDFRGMFLGCVFETLDINNFNTSSAIEMDQMFYSNRNLKSLDISGFSTKNVLGMKDMFNYCELLSELKLGPDFTVWNNDTALPEGEWVNGSLVKTETELAAEYPINATEWAGTWTHKPAIKTITFDTYWVTINEGESTKLSFNYTPENGDPKSLIWSSEDESIVEVDETGTITGKSEGNANVIVKLKNNEYYSRQCLVIVTKKQSVTPHWESNSTGWWYVREDGTYPVNAFENIDGRIYYFNGSGYMVTGWQKINGEYYFFQNSGVMKVSAWEGNYYLLEDGRMAKSQWIDDKYYVDENGKWVPNYGTAHWESNSIGWWYVRADGSYPTNTFEEINGKTYYFNGSGYMVTGWQKIDGEYYFFETSGAMKTSAWEGNYYLLEDGKMAKSQWIDDKYYVGEDGKWIPNYGTAHWESNSIGWWYVRADGSYPTNTFEEINGKTYYFNGSGYMVTGWQKVNGEYYFFETSGAMKTSAWEGNYYLLEDGRMAKSQWIDDKYYVDENGKWVPDYPKE